MVRKKLRYTIIVLFSILCTKLSAQPPDTLWTKTYGGTDREWGTAIDLLPGNGYVIFGTTYSFGAGMNDIYLIRTDSCGNLLWSKTYGTTVAEGARSGKYTHDGGYIIAGIKSGAPLAENVYIVKTDSLGDTLWTKEYGGQNQDEAYEIQQTSDNGYIIVGFTGSYGIGTLYGPNIYLIKIDSIGTQEWFKAIGDTTWEMGFSVQQTVDGGYILVGITNYKDYDTSDVYLIKTDSLGNIIWTQTYGGDNYDYGEKVIETQDGGFIIVGETASFGAGNYDIYVIKTDETGNVQWTKTFGGSNDDTCFDIQEVFGEGYVICGTTQSYGAGGADVYIVRIDVQGNLLWSKTIGGSDYDYGEAICITENRDYIITGNTESFGAGMQDVYLIKVAADTLGKEENRLSDANFVINCSTNPVHDKISIHYKLYRTSFVSIKIYNIFGKEIRVLVEQQEKPGTHFISWYGTDAAQNSVSNGVYFLNFKIGNYTQTKKLIFLRD